MQRGFWLALGAIGIVLVGLFIAAGGKSGDSTNPYVYSEPFKVQPAEHVTGAGPVQIIEYGDFQCPACGAIFPTLAQVKAQLPDKVTFIFRHFPLVRVHPNAMAAHRAAEAAGKQGKFFEMHDLLYQSQPQWASGSNAAAFFETLAQNLGLNMDQFRQDVGSADVFARIEADQKSGQELGISATPGIFVNGQKLENVPRDFAGWQKLVDDELAKQQTGQ